MKRAADIIGLSVLCIRTGEQIGIIRDIACDPQTSVLGFMLEPKSLFSHGKYIRLQDVKAIGEDAVTVYAEDIIHPMDDAEQQAGREMEQQDEHAVARKDHEHHIRGLYNGEKLKGIRVVTTNGNELGLVEDVYFDEEVGTIVGYELSEGIVADITEGRKYLPKPVHITLGKDVIIVPRSSEFEIEDWSDHKEAH
ncbi:hypothetical protein BHU72_08835 [Desulfuribacillus stibiiarsenatis]|uniref:PRC-barrel domain-containing protein n=1 Tax=Desulfuribacillus stibiiarsenatis TaxID=1390249 RepID=A0A1E5L394_9FIRM|nr:PRC-barrel domain-containing protein [Desulfuribacillus stibiiarsenatis]OEH84592.1 hypothetical protein BHU72_08835 [Desulfuribacillus stibiiarsenatis]